MTSSTSEDGDELGELTYLVASGSERFGADDSQTSAEEYVARLFHVELTATEQDALVGEHRMGRAILDPGVFHQP